MLRHGIAGSFFRWLKSRVAQVLTSEQPHDAKLRLSLWIAGGLAVLVALAFLGLLGFYWAVQRRARVLSPGDGTRPRCAENGQRRISPRGRRAAKCREQGRTLESSLYGRADQRLVGGRPREEPPEEFADDDVAIREWQSTRSRSPLLAGSDDPITSSVISLTIEPYVPEPNVLALRIVKARAGLLPMPLGQAPIAFPPLPAI